MTSRSYTSRALATVALSTALLLGPSTSHAQTFDPWDYLGQGDAYNCRDVGSQANAQAILRADPSDPNGLDGDADGYACERNTGARDWRRVPR